MALSGLLERSAMKLSKICNDLRLLSSGPQAGLGEINLPPRQAGSSIMPGKVNPVIPEVLNQIAFTVMGADVTVSMAAEAGRLQLNAFEPVIAHSILRSIDWMTRGMRTLRLNCVDGITANCAWQKQSEQMLGGSRRFSCPLASRWPASGYLTSIGSVGTDDVDATKPGQFRDSQPLIASDAGSSLRPDPTRSIKTQIVSGSPYKLT